MGTVARGPAGRSRPRLGATRIIVPGGLLLIGIIAFELVTSVGTIPALLESLLEFSSPSDQIGAVIVGIPVLIGLWFLDQDTGENIPRWLLGSTSGLALVLAIGTMSPRIILGSLSDGFDTVASLFWLALIGGAFLPGTRAGARANSRRRSSSTATNDGTDDRVPGSGPRVRHRRRLPNHGRPVAGAGRGVLPEGARVGIDPLDVTPDAHVLAGRPDPSMVSGIDVTRLHSVLQWAFDGMMRALRGCDGSTFNTPLNGSADFRPGCASYQSKPSHTASDWAIEDIGSGPLPVI